MYAVSYRVGVKDSNAASSLSLAPVWWDSGFTERTSSAPNAEHSTEHKAFPARNFVTLWVRIQSQLILKSKS